MLISMSKTNQMLRQTTETQACQTTICIQLKCHVLNTQKGKCMRSIPGNGTERYLIEKNCFQSLNQLPYNSAVP